MAPPDDRHTAVEMRPGGLQQRAVVAGIVFSVAFHAACGLLLFSAATAGRDGVAPLPAPAAAERPRRRAPFGALGCRDRRRVEGPLPRLHRFGESSHSRRPILDILGRRRPAESASRPYRFVELPRGRRLCHDAHRRDERSIDFGLARDRVLQAMLIPRLGLKKASKYRLPRLTKYEQPERVEDGINISRHNPDGKTIKHKAFRKKKAQYDRRRKKAPTLDELIDSPDDADPRKRASALDEIVGVAHGSTTGQGTVGAAGNVYLGKVEAAIRSAFNVPVFMSHDELRKLVVEIEIRRMDGKGKVRVYKIRRKSKSTAFNTAALEAIKRFVPAEGGSRTLPRPEPEILESINQRGLLVRLEGRKLR